MKARFARVQTASEKDARFVIFLQDVASIENQAQQLKLASMGRLTASIAHEVRNPLAAISHASELLEEEASNNAQTRLLNIVSENVTRMNRMIEDILNLSRKVQSSDPISVLTVVEQVHATLTEMHDLPKDMIQFADVGDLSVRFDPASFARSAAQSARQRDPVRQRTCRQHPHSRCSRNRQPRRTSCARRRAKHHTRSARPSV